MVCHPSAFSERVTLVLLFCYMYSCMSELLFVDNTYKHTYMSSICIHLNVWIARILMSCKVYSFLAVILRMSLEDPNNNFW